MALPIHCLVIGARNGVNPAAASLLADAHALGVLALTDLECYTLYFLEGDIPGSDLDRLSVEVLSDPVAQTSAWRSHLGDGVAAFNNAGAQHHVIETAPRPGVTDRVAEEIARCAHMLGVASVRRAATGQRFVLHGVLTDAERHFLARRLLANPVIQRYAFGPIEPSFPEVSQASALVEVIALRELDDAELLAVSRERRAALDLAEMQAVQQYFREAGRDPTDVEFETIAQTWSEHCVHKTFKARITLPRNRPAWHHSLATKDRVGEQIDKPASEVDGLLRTYLRATTDRIAAPWVRSAFVDNAGIVDFDDEFEISFKVETHNHPSAIEPFGGANTGVGGVVRDVLGVSAKPIAATDVLCFGPQALGMDTALPEGVLPPRRVRSGVVAGIGDYGNKLGVPTVNGAIWYDSGYTANPLVFCGCVGLAPKNRHPRQPIAGDHVVVLGGRTGRDGLRGATFSSMPMDAQTGEVAGASVQIGDPITEKGLIEVVTRAREAGLYHAVTDCGAGGLSSAVGEMGSQVGAEVDVTRVRLKYPGLAPWEIWLSEAQERMVLAVPEAALPKLQALCDTFGIEQTDIGQFTGTGRLLARAGERLILDLDNEFLHNGLPQRRLTAVWPAVGPLGPGADLPAMPDYAGLLLALLRHPNLASKADVIRSYDHEVQGGTVVKPLTGAANDGPADACVLKPMGTGGTRGIVLANGLNPEYGKRDAYRMAVSVVDEAIRNAVAAGADPARIALLDNFCWGDPQRPETLGALVAAVRGCCDAALHYGAPFISGKDSLNNEYTGSDGRRHAIPPTLLISALGLIDDVSQSVTTDLKAPGDLLYLLGEPQGRLGGGHLGLLGMPAYTALAEAGEVPDLAEWAPGLYRALHGAIRAGLVRACHDVSEGGLAVAAAEMCIGGRLGMALSVEAAEPLVALFGETNGALLVEVRAEDAGAFERHLAGQPARRIGHVTAGSQLAIRAGGGGLQLPMAELVSAWSTLPG
ncbi:MAG: phosphoribosylformylglycinamidine synthase subunit PurL [Anaerolineales bacterium]|nr:phosphoribosylformylglycinamidine synthase subunit PurL [Anaerolineales bacterium]